MRPGFLACITAVWTAVVVPPVHAVDELLPPKFELKEESTGSHLPRNVLTGIAVPINRRYSELTDEQKEVVKSRYEAMRPTDEPPYPVDGLSPLYKAIHQLQRKVLAEGELVIFIEVDAAGKAASASVIKALPLDPDMTLAVAQILMLTKYKPAVCSGRPCAMGYPFRVNFSVSH